MDYATEEAVGVGCSGGVYTCMLSYTQTKPSDISVAGMLYTSQKKKRKHKKKERKKPIFLMTSGI